MKTKRFLAFLIATAVLLCGCHPEPKQKVRFGFAGYLPSADTIATTNQATRSGLAQTVASVALSAPGMKVWLVGQTTITEDGCYLVAPTAWTRCDEAPVGTDLGGARFNVKSGSNAGPWTITNPPGSGIIGVNDITASSGGGGGSGYPNPGNANLDLASTYKVVNAVDPTSAQDLLTLNFYDVNFYTNKRQFAMREEWITGAPAGANAWAISVASSGTVTSVTTNQSATHWGFAQLNSAASATASATLSLPGVNAVQPGSVADISVEIEFQIPTLPTVGTQDAILRCGLGDVYNGSDINNGVVVEVNLANDSHYVLETAGSSTQERHASTVSVDTGFHRIRLHKSEGSTHWGMFIDGTDTGLASATNEPNGANVGYLCNLKKSTGTSAITVLLDWFDIYATWSTPRNN